MMRTSPQSTLDEVLVADTLDEHAAFAAEILGRAIWSAVEERGVARVALSGGNTPSETYQRLAAMALPFDRLEWYWVDERGVPSDHPRSNYGAAARDLSLADGKHGRPFRMEGERDLAEAASAYERGLRRQFGVAASAAFDAMTLGIGDDGHTASLFPGIGATLIDDRLVARIREQPEKNLEARITLTAPVILEARLAVMIVRGASKQKVVEAAQSHGSEERECRPGSSSAPRGRWCGCLTGRRRGKLRGAAMRRFNTAGPCRPEVHYMIPPERRMPESLRLVDHQAYFALHAPRQTGKTTTVRALAARLTEGGRYAALHFSCESARVFPEDVGAAERVIVSAIAASAENHLPEALRPPSRTEADPGGTSSGPTSPAGARAARARWS